MAAAQLKPVFHDPSLPPVARFPAEAEQVIAPSPALLLQQRLQAGTMLASEPQKWPLGGRVALIVSTSLALWLAIITAAAELVRAIA